MLDLQEIITESIKNGIVLFENKSNINNILRRYFQEHMPEYIGCNGSVESQLFSIADELESDGYDEEYTDNDIEWLQTIYSQYKNAMGRRRPESVLEDYKFFNYILNHALCFNYGDSYIFGQYNNGYFKVSHFAPSTMREGYEMLKELSTFDNVIFTVTDDLSPMLQKIGLYGNHKAVISMFFRNELVQKQIYTSDRELLDYYVQQIIRNNYEELYNMLQNSDDSVDFRDIVRTQKTQNNYATNRQRLSMHDREYR